MWPLGPGDQVFFKEEIRRTLCRGQLGVTLGSEL